MSEGFITVGQALDELRAGRFIIITDDENRENEGDLCCAARFITPEMVNFMVTRARGLICVPMKAELLRRLELPPMVQTNTARLRTNFTVSVDAADGITTGISAADRAQTIRVLSNPHSRPEDLARPGHIFPLGASPGGVMVRAGQTEAIVDLCRLAGLEEVGVICEIMNEDGAMARLPRLLELSHQWSIPIITVADIIQHRHRTERLVQPGTVRDFHTNFGRFKLHPYLSLPDGQEHYAVVKEPLDTAAPVLVRVHSESLINDAFGAFAPDGGTPLANALRMIDYHGSGVLLYMRRCGGREDASGHPMQSETLRNYGIGAQILADLGIHRMRLITNHPRKIVGLESYGLEVVEFVPMHRLEPLPVSNFPTQFGAFKLHPFVSAMDNKVHLALVKGDVSGEPPVLVRVHSECLTGDVLHSLRCDCGPQLSTAMARIEEEGRGVLLYLRQEGRGIGLANKLKAYALQDDGMDTIEANVALGFEDDERSYQIPADMLRRLGVTRVRLMTNNPEKVNALAEQGFQVERVAHVVGRPTRTSTTWKPRKTR